MRWTVDATRIQRVTVEVEADNADDAYALGVTAADESTDWTAYSASVDSCDPTDCTPQFGGLVASEVGV